MASQIRKRIKLPGYKLNKRAGLKTHTIIEQEARLRRLVSHILNSSCLVRFLDENNSNLCLLLTIGLSKLENFILSNYLDAYNPQRHPLWIQNSYKQWENGSISKNL